MTNQMNHAQIVGIHADLYGEYPLWLRQFESILVANGIEARRLDSNDPDFFDQVKGLSAFIFRWRHIAEHHYLAQTILPIIQNEMHIPCFPDSATSWHFDDKIRQYYLMKLHGFPMIDSWAFYDRDRALDWVRTAEYPVVFKLRGGAGSQNVVLLRSARHAEKMVRIMFERGAVSLDMVEGGTRLRDFGLLKVVARSLRSRFGASKKNDLQPRWQLHRNYALFQRFMPGNDCDTRVTIIGNRAFAFRRLNRDNDFRSSGSGRLEYDPSKIDPAFVAKAFEVSKVMGFQSMAYDFLYDTNRQPVFCEISYTFVYKAIQACPGYWDSELTWHDGPCWPQLFILQDFLNRPDLVLPADFPV